MDDLHNIIDNIDRDNSFEIIEIIKGNQYGRTEKVRAPNNKTYIRKYFSHDSNFSIDKLEAVSKLSHPNLPNTYDYYQLADQSVIIQDYISGYSLTDLIEEEGSLDAQDAVQIAMALCNAVEYMHNQEPNPIIHRDIKPDNIMICGDDVSSLQDEVRLIDFGAIREFKAESNRDTVYIGTPGYASPEQFGFGQTDIRTDIYSIGQTLMHMLTGEPPERGKSPQTPDIPHQLWHIIQKATEFDPDERYQKVTDLKYDLIKYSKTIRQAAQTPSRITHEVIVDNSSIQDHESSKPKRKMYPIHNNMPFGLKIALIPVHLFIIVLLGYSATSSLIEPTEFGRMDNIILTVENIGFASILFYYYIIGFNLFNINHRWRFFHTRRITKKILSSFIIFILYFIFFIIITEFHSEAYSLANSANS